MKEKNQSLLIRNAEFVVTMNQKREILSNASVLITANRITEVNSEVNTADRVIDGSGMVLLPGLINCHDHMSQTFVRNIPSQLNQPIQKWIAGMCTLVSKMDAEAHYYAALCSMIELIKGGCTTSVDFSYIFPKNQQNIFESTISAAQEIGIRFQPYRSCITKRDGENIFPDLVCENIDDVISQLDGLYQRYKEGKDGMLRLGTGPCAPFTSSEADIRKIVDYAQKHNLFFQMHIAESQHEQTFVESHYHTSSVIEWLQSLGCQGRNVSLVHCIYTSQTEFSALKTMGGVVHCPISNAHDSGDISVAPVTEMLKEHVPVGLGVDGAAANDGKNLLTEARIATLLQGVRKGFGSLNPMVGLEMATIGGAQVIGREKEIGSIEEGKYADIVMFDISRSIEIVGSFDPVGSLVKSQAIPADFVIIDGKVIIKNRKFTGLDEVRIIKDAMTVWKNIFDAKRENYAKC